MEATILAAAITLAESYVKGSGWPYKLTPEPAPADDPFLESETEPSAQTASAMSTGYRVGVVPGAIEVSARLSTAQEVRQLIKVLRAGILVFAATPTWTHPKVSISALQRSRLLLLKQ